MANGGGNPGPVRLEFLCPRSVLRGLVKAFVTPVSQGDGMTRLFALLVLCLALGAGGPAAAADLVARVDVSEQMMRVYHRGRLAYQWKVSTARSGKHTPRGTFTAQFLSRDHRSSLYNNAPMPFSIFFHGNYAVHGTDQVSRLGSPASAGCVRLHPAHAAVLFDLTRKVGLANMQVVITN